MTNFKWLSVADIKAQYKMTDNVPQGDIDRAVKEAFDFDINPVLSDAYLDAVLGILQTNPQQWNKNKTYAINDICFLDNVYYRAVSMNTDSEPTPLNTDWAELDLISFWLDYVKKYFVACAYYRLMLWHGANVTQYGFGVITDENYIDISDKRRGDLMSSVNSQRDIYLSKLNKAWSMADGTFDSVRYSKDSGDKKKPNKSVKIWSSRKPPVYKERWEKLDDGNC